MNGWMKGLGLFGVLAILSAVAGYFIGGQGSAEYESSAKVAFVEDTRFDYVDAERDRLIGLVENDPLLVADGVVKVEYERPDTSTFLDVIVTATSPEFAARTANSLADAMVLGDLTERRRPIEAEIEILSEQIADITVDIEALDAEIADLARQEAFAEANRFKGTPAEVERLTVELRSAQDSYWLKTRSRSSLDIYRNEAIRRINSLEADLAGAVAQTRVVRPALVRTGRSDVTSAKGALIGALVALGVAGVGLAALKPDRRGRDL